MTPDPNPDAIDRYIERQLERQHIPALSLAVAKEGKILKQQAYGFADVERQVRATPASVFEIGSITKQFTAVAVMLLVDQGRLGLNDAIGKVVAGLPQVWQAVTLRHLLTHTSGIPDYEEIMGYGAYRNPMTPEQVIAVAAARPMDFNPGERWNYSNTGYYLLTLAIEKAGGEPFAAFLRKHVHDPAGMLETRSSEPADIIAHRAAGYRHQGGRLENRDPMQPSATGGAGMLVSTTSDLLKWEATLARQGILSPASYAALWTDAPLNDGELSGYGLGWFVGPVRQRRSQRHSGGTAGFKSDLWRLPDDGLCVVVLTNSFTADAQSIASHVARHYLPALAFHPVADLEPEMAQVVLDFLRHRSDDEVYAQPLTPELAARIKSYWGERLDYHKALGPPLALALVERYDVGASRHYRYRVRYGEVSRLVQVTCKSGTLIADMAAEEE